MTGLLTVSVSFWQVAQRLTAKAVLSVNIANALCLAMSLDFAHRQKRLDLARARKKKRECVFYKIILTFNIDFAILLCYT